MVTMTTIITDTIMTTIITITTTRDPFHLEKRMATFQNLEVTPEGQLHHFLVCLEAMVCMVTTIIPITMDTITGDSEHQTLFMLHNRTKE